MIRVDVPGLLGDYANGPTAGPEATARALEKCADASAVVLVEGVSDQIAVESAALRREHDLAARRVVVVPVGGAHATRRFLTRFGPDGAGLRVAGLYDVGEEAVLLRAFAAAGLGTPTAPADLERLGFHACVVDLEDELIRAVGVPRVEALVAEHGELGSFRTMQRQEAWRGRPVEAQLRRFIAGRARRKLCYARLLVETVHLDRMPRPLDAVLTHALGAA